VFSTIYFIPYNIRNIFIPEGFLSLAEIADNGEVEKQTSFLYLGFCGLCQMRNISFGGLIMS
jgi:hypothetical protein